MLTRSLQTFKNFEFVILFTIVTISFWGWLKFYGLWVFITSLLLLLLFTLLIPRNNKCWWRPSDRHLAKLSWRWPPCRNHVAATHGVHIVFWNVRHLTTMCPPCSWHYNKNRHYAVTSPPQGAPCGYHVAIGKWLTGHHHRNMTAMWSPLGEHLMAMFATRQRHMAVTSSFRVYRDMGTLFLSKLNELFFFSRIGIEAMVKICKFFVQQWILNLSTSCK